MRLRRDVRAYGRMEAGNAVAAPALGLYFGWPSQLADAVLLGLALVAVTLGLVAGARYWLALDARLKHRPGPMDRAMAFASAAQLPMLVATILAAFGLAATLIFGEWSRSNSVAAIATALAALEYLNYYHVQLQHFDNANDSRRLLSGRGFRRAHLARDLARWRRRK